MKGNKKLNSQVFTPEEVKQGLHLDLIRYLLEMNEKSETQYNQILIDTDGYCTMVEWVQRSYKDDSCDDRFEKVEYDELVMKEVHFPDNHYDYVPRCEAEQALRDWCEEHPNYRQDSYGRWYDVNEYKQELVDEQTNQPKQLSLEDFGIIIE